jgi:hypothetical protein
MPFAASLNSCAQLTDCCLLLTLLRFPVHAGTFLPLVR